MVTEDEETRETIATTIAQLGANYKLATSSKEKAKIEKEAKNFVKTVAKGEDEVAEYTKMYNEMKG